MLTAAHWFWIGSDVIPRRWVFTFDTNSITSLVCCPSPSADGRQSRPVSVDTVTLTGSAVQKDTSPHDHTSGCCLCILPVWFRSSSVCKLPWWTSLCVPMPLAKDNHKTTEIHTTTYTILYTLNTRQRGRERGRDKARKSRTGRGSTSAMAAVRGQQEHSRRPSTALDRRHGLQQSILTL